MRRQTPEGQKEWIIPRETVGRELAKALFANAARAITLLEEAGGLPVVFPGLGPLLTHDYLTPARRGRRSLTSTVALLTRGLPPEQVGSAMRASGLPSLPTHSVLRIREDDVTWIVGRLQQAEERPESMRASEFE